MSIECVASTKKYIIFKYYTIKIDLSNYKFQFFLIFFSVLFNVLVRKISRKNINFLINEKTH